MIDQNTCNFGGSFEVLIILGKEKIKFSSTAFYKLRSTKSDFKSDLTAAVFGISGKASIKLKEEVQSWSLQVYLLQVLHLGR